LGSAHQLNRLLFSKAARLRRATEPSKTIDGGSGTAPVGVTPGWASAKIALLLAVAIQCGLLDVPSLKKPLIKDPIGRLGSLEAKFSRGEMFGLEAPCSVTLVKLTWYKKKAIIYLTHTVAPTVNRALQPASIFD
jgi:hypothetical protein